MAAEAGALELNERWSILFAREPEPELELEEMGEAQEDEIVGQEPKAKKPKGRGPLIVVVTVLLIVGAVLYLNPDLIFSMLGGEPPPPPPVAKKAPAPPASVTPAPAVPAVPAASEPPSAPPPAPSAPMSAPAAPAAAPAPAPPPMTVAKAPAATGIPTPLFGEGQRVTVKADPGSPAGIALTQDSAATHAGSLVRTGTTLVVLDAELQNNVWVYSVKADDGTRGWISEKHLQGR